MAPLLQFSDCPREGEREKERDRVCVAGIPIFQTPADVGHKSDFGSRGG